MNVSTQTKLDFLKEKQIFLDDNLKGIRGIYGFFAKNKSEEKCLYVGKAFDIYERIILNNSGHLNIYYFLLHNGGESKNRTEVHDVLDKYHYAGYNIEARVIKKVDYDFSKSFEYNANLLALEELKAIVKYQQYWQCEYQIHESVHYDEIGSFPKHKVIYGTIKILEQFKKKRKESCPDHYKLYFEDRLWTYNITPNDTGIRLSKTGKGKHAFYSLQCNPYEYDEITVVCKDLSETIKKELNSFLNEHSLKIIEPCCKNGDDDTVYHIRKVDCQT